MKAPPVPVPSDPVPPARRRRGRPRVRGLGWLAAALAVSGLPAPAAAPDEAMSTEELKKLSLEQLMELQVPTVYGASKFEQKITEAPSSVSIVGGDEIRKQGHRTLADILNGIRGFYVNYDRGYRYVGTRGYNHPGDFGGRILLMIDGHRMNDGIFDTAASGMEFLLDVDLIERVEVIRGPGSSLYGDNAFFGVINVVTRRGQDVGGGEVAASYSSFDTWNGRASVGKVFANGLEVLLSGSGFVTEGRRRLAFPEFVAQNLDGEEATSAFAKVSYGDLTLEGGWVRRRKEWPMAAYDTVPGSMDPQLLSIDQRAFADLTYQNEFESEWQVTARAYFDRYQFDGVFPDDADGNPATRLVDNRDFAAATSVGFDVSASRPIGERHRFAAGTEWRHDLALEQRVWDVDPPNLLLDSRENADFVGVYLQDEWRFARQWKLLAGVRYDEYFDVGGTVNPRVALNYEPWESGVFKVLYGQAFRAPNAYERYYRSLEHRENPNLEAETVRSYEVVWEQHWGPSWRTTFSAFRNEVDNLVVQSLDPGADPVSTGDDMFFFDNAGEALMQGVEFEVEGILAGGVTTRASYTLTEVEDSATGRRLANSPEHMGKASVSVPVWKEKLFASLQLRAMGDRPTVWGGEAPSHAVVDFTLYARELAPGLEVAASVYNVFDHRYLDPVGEDFTYQGPLTGRPVLLDMVQQDGRTLRLKLTYRF